MRRLSTFDPILRLDSSQPFRGLVSWAPWLHGKCDDECEKQTEVEAYTRPVCTRPLRARTRARFGAGDAHGAATRRTAMHVRIPRAGRVRRTPHFFCFPDKCVLCMPFPYCIFFLCAKNCDDPCTTKPIFTGAPGSPPRRSHWRGARSPPPAYWRAGGRVAQG